MQIFCHALSSFLFIGFYDGNKDFGIVKKGKHIPCSDFSFNFLAEVICIDSRSSGYMIELTPGRSESDASQCKRYPTIAHIIGWERGLLVYVPMKTVTTGLSPVVMWVSQ